MSKHTVGPCIKSGIITPCSSIGSDKNYLFLCCRSYYRVNTQLLYVLPHYCRQSELAT